MTKEDLKECAALCNEADALAGILAELERRRGSPGWTELAELAYGCRVRFYKSFLKRVERRLEEVSKALNKLPSNERQLLILRYFCGYSWQKIAQELGYSEDNVRGYLHRKALEHLQVNTS